MITYEDFKKIELKTGLILSVDDVEGSEKLYQLSVRIGEEKKQIIAGLKKYYSKAELLNKTVIVVYNLEPKKIFGLTSEGMLLAVESKGIVSLLTPDKPMPSGLRVW